MSAFSAHLEGAIADWIGGAAFPAAPTGLFLALSRQDPLDDGTGAAEPVDANYARQAIVFTKTGPINGTGATLEQSGHIIFPASDSGYGTMTHWAIYDAASGGNLLFKGGFAVDVTNAAGESYAVPDGTISVVIR